MQNNLYQQYAQIRQEQKALDLFESALRERILKDMQENKAVKEEFEFGRFTVATKKTYIYTDRVRELEEKVKIAMFKEVEKGEAKIKKTDYLIFKHAQ